MIPNRRYEGYVQDGRFYVDRHTLAKICNRSVAAVRRHCKPSVEHVNAAGRTTRTFYDVEACGAVLERLRPRRRAVVDQGG